MKKKKPDSEAIPSEVLEWFASQGWRPFEYQKDVWRSYLSGESGLMHCSTGAGKTYAIWFAVLIGAIREQLREVEGLQVLWITPMRALAADTELTLRAPLEKLGLNWTVGRWTGDVNAREKQKIRKKIPNVLVITPESLSLLLSQPEFVIRFASLQLIVVDEWHELLSTKRGVLTELALARLRHFSPKVRVWGLTATVGNIDEAAKTLGGFDLRGVERPMRVIQGNVPKRIVIETIFPSADRKFPWAGHLGIQLLPDVTRCLRKHKSTIIFTNTRSQAELWYHSLCEAMPDWQDQIALHHGSIDFEIRQEAEEGLRNGTLRAVVATSSLDLGVDFSPVECVIQVGSPKGIARLLQRAGRSGHRPGVDSKIIFVPANTLELLEIAAARDLVSARLIESRHSVRRSLDVLCQHVLSTAAGSSFKQEEFFLEVRSTRAYHELSREEWLWVLEFAGKGGSCLKSYPEYARLEEIEGKYYFKEKALLQRHRMSIGTITSDASISVVLLQGKRLGSIEESFVSKLRPGDRFLFSGRRLELVRIRDLKAYVRLAKGKSLGGIPRWLGGKLPLSTELAQGIRSRLDAIADGVYEGKEIQRLIPLLEIQKETSKIPKQNELVIERLHSREGHHLFFYPFEGRNVHEGLAALCAFRLSKIQPNSFTIAVNDYGFELLSPTSALIEEGISKIFQADNLLEDILGSINCSEMARRRFREIARIAGLTFEGYPGRKKGLRNIQVSSSLLFEVFKNYEPDNLLLAQATREVLEYQLHQERIEEAMDKIRTKSIHLIDIFKPSPFSYPLFVERLREQLSNEDLAERVHRMELLIEKTI